MMQSVRVVVEGHLVLPKCICERHGWRAGSQLSIEDQGDCVVIRNATDLPTTTLEDIAGCAGYGGPPRTLEEMEAGIVGMAKTLLAQ